MKKPPRPIKPTIPLQTYEESVRKKYTCSEGASVKDIIDWAAGYGVLDMSTVRLDTVYADSFSERSCEFEMSTTISVKLPDEVFEKEMEKYKQAMDIYTIQKKEYDAYYNEKDKQDRIKLENEEKALLKKLLEKYPQ
jgi:hypothetical protein